MYFYAFRGDGGDYSIGYEKTKNLHILKVHKKKNSYIQFDLKEGRVGPFQTPKFPPSPVVELVQLRHPSHPLALQPYCVLQITRFSYSADRGMTKCIRWIFLLHSHGGTTYILFDRFPLQLQKKHPPPASEAETAPKVANCQCIKPLNCSSHLKMAG